MSFIDLLQDSDNYFQSTINRMKKNGKPIVLFGAGCLGEMTWEFMSRHNIAIDYISLNQKYINSEDNLHDIPIVAIEDLVEKTNHFNYIIALQFVSAEIKDQLNKNGEEILIFDPSFIGVNTTKYYTSEFCKLNEKILTDLYNDLADEKSRETMVAFFNQRISTKRGFIQKVYDASHYFPQDVFLLQENEVFIDCGAYTGDSIDAFVREIEKQKISKIQRIIGYEPDIANFSKLVKNTYHMSFCECLNKGVWNRESQLSFESGKALSSRINEENENGITISLGCIDDMLQGDIATFIKMDVEGAELKALEGASQTIKKHQPLLAISVYHKPDDLITIPQYIKSLSHSYKFYLRAHHPELAFELVLYAVPINRTLQ